MSDPSEILGARAGVAVAATALIASLAPLTGATPAASADSSCGAWTTVDHASLPDHGYDVDYYLKTRKCTTSTGAVSRRFTSVACNRKATGKSDWTVHLVRNGTIVWQPAPGWTFPSVGNCKALNSEGEFARAGDEVVGGLTIGYDGQQDEADYLRVEYTMP
ncbi:hypothetical protein [Nocardioides speluncae]|uniref:hypothetical protein n=1 Tax=Nocardioides speluncae TaxID=2670337 RepID=UPI000D6972C7|nr:hypothetical protein [Nocardioides speluncae]